jgi:Na+/citrate or Na+/malate symporter
MPESRPVSPPARWTRRRLAGLAVLLFLGWFFYKIGFSSPAHERFID